MAPHPPACPVCQSPHALCLPALQERVYWRCTGCGARFLSPAQRPPPEVERAHYLLHRNDVRDAGYRRFLSRLAQPLLQRLPAARSGLDYGCGPAPALAAMLAEAGHSMRIYDPQFFPDDAALDAQYDFVTCTEVAEHFHAPAREFARLAGLLRSGGVLAVMTGFPPGDEAFATWHYARDPTHVVFYDAGTLQLIAARHGLACEIPCRDVALLTRRD